VPANEFLEIMRRQPRSTVESVELPRTRRAAKAG
jgi:hypothetical protein